MLDVASAYFRRSSSDVVLLFYSQMKNHVLEFAAPLDQLHQLSLIPEPLLKSGNETTFAIPSYM